MFSVGYAFVSESGEIDIKTVSPTELGAMVNAAIILSDGRVIPLSYWNEQEIRVAFQRLLPHGGSIKKVSIEIAPD